MPNREVAAARRYHEGTKHPGGELMDPRHAFDPARRPMLLKMYTDGKRVPLPVDTATLGMPGLEAISPSTLAASGEQLPDVGTLGRVLYFSNGITRKITYPWGEMSFRAAACTGALYHIEIYVVCGDIDGLGAGVYHFDAAEPSLVRLRDGDHRGTLIEAAGAEPSIARAPVVLVYTDVRWRNAIKYQAREYRHAFWDSGTILSHTAAICRAHGMSAKLVTGFVDETVNRLLDLDTEREGALALVAMGQTSVTPAVPLPAEPLNLKTLPISDHELQFPAIGEMHCASSLITADEVREWRGEASLANPSPSGEIHTLEAQATDEISRDPIEQVILRRGSTRRFAREAISRQQLATILSRASHGMPADFLQSPNAAANRLYLIVSSVDGLPSGSYVFHRQELALELLKRGDFRREAGHLGLDQELPADASVNVYFLADLAPLLETFGNRGYRVAQLDAAIAAGNFYLAAYAQRLGASGLTFYDDEVIDFFSPHAAGLSVMFLMAIGKRVRRDQAKVG